MVCCVVCSARAATTDTVDFNSGPLADAFSVNTQIYPTLGVSNYSLAANGLGGSQGVDLAAGTTADATLVYKLRSYQLSTLSSLDVSCFFRKQASTDGFPAQALGIVGSSASRLAGYDIVDTLTDSCLTLRPGRNTESLRFEIQSKAGNTGPPQARPTSARI